MSIKPAILAEDERLVREILRRHLPSGTRVFVFGSRATMGGKPFSDLDLLLEGASPLPMATLAALRDAFDESPLPWKVDLVDRLASSDTFTRLVDAQKIPFDLD